MWIRTDEQEEAVAALEAFTRFLPFIRGDRFAWRWVILSLHIALQGFMVVAIRDSAGLSPIPDDLAAAWLLAHRCGLPTPAERLDKFQNPVQEDQAREHRRSRARPSLQTLGHTRVQRQASESAIS
jgi:hypothetical protein